ncbi:MAG TPA: helix-turn-helix transcriptional regulator [Spirochaetia bacterium]|nr:helix-turn-helix transcriptional regulator [Spirochaetia bacterium]
MGRSHARAGHDAGVNGTRRATYRHAGKLFKADTCDDVFRASLRGEIELQSLARGSYPGTRLDEKSLPGVKSLGFWNATREQDWGLRWHRNEGIELTILSSGSLPYFCGDKRYDLRPYDLTIARPWQPHKVGDPAIGPNKLFFFILDVGVRRPNQDWTWPGWILMNRAERDELTKLLRQNELHVWSECRDFHHCFQEIGRAVEEYPKSKDVTYIALKLNELFYLLLHMFRTRRIPLNESLTSNFRTVQVFLGELRELLTEDWSIERMAKECGVCTTRFVQYCRQLTNQSPMQHLNTLRLERARALLVERRSMPIIDIAMDCGFATSQYFASCFKRKYHVTPSDYRNTRLSLTVA